MIFKIIMTNGSSDQYKEVCRGTDILSADVADLKPNTCYHFRLKLTYLGSTLVSESMAIPTLVGVPSVPGKPRIKFFDRPCAFDDGGKLTQVRATIAAVFGTRVGVTESVVCLKVVVCCCCCCWWWWC